MIVRFLMARLGRALSTSHASTTAKPATPSAITTSSRLVTNSWDVRSSIIVQMDPSDHESDHPTE